MAKVWKYILIAAVILLAFGVLLSGAGLLTGASFDRTWTGLGLGSRLEQAMQMLQSFQLPF